MSEDLEEPKFKIIQEYRDFEIREYVDTVQAQVASHSTKEVSSSTHFREIASYIFGNNNTSQNISMTAPVHTWSKNNKTFMAFTMPSRFSLEKLPKPNSSRLQLLNIKGKIIAVLKFSWFSGDKRTGKLIQKLQELIKAEGLKQTGTPKLAVYDNPMTTLPFARRNEIHIPIEWPANRL